MSGQFDQPLPQQSAFSAGDAVIGAPPEVADAARSRLRRLVRRIAGLARPWLYAGYEVQLLHQVRAGAMPRHVGIILDGNRRHARGAGLRDFRRIYAMGAGKLDEVLDWCGELGVRAVTLWVCSTDNLARPAEEVSGILAAIEQKMRSLAADPQIRRLGCECRRSAGWTCCRHRLLPRSRRLVLPPRRTGK